MGVGSSTDVALMFGGALTLIIGEFLETLVCHIPKNDALAAHKGGNDADVWAKYYASWTAWNHVRMVASLATVVQFALALFYRGATLGGRLRRPALGLCAPCFSPPLHVGRRRTGYVTYVCRTVCYVELAMR